MKVIKEVVDIPSIEAKPRLHPPGYRTSPQALCDLVVAAASGVTAGGIPRQRMDRQRDSGALPQLVNSFLDAVMLVSGLLIPIVWVPTRNFLEGVEEVTIGVGAGIAGIQAAEVGSSSMARGLRC